MAAGPIAERNQGTVLGVSKRFWIFLIRKNVFEMVNIDIYNKTFKSPIHGRF